MARLLCSISLSLMLFVFSFIITPFCSVLFYQYLFMPRPQSGGNKQTAVTTPKPAVVNPAPELRQEEIHPPALEVFEPEPEPQVQVKESKPTPPKPAAQTTTIAPKTENKIEQQDLSYRSLPLSPTAQSAFDRAKTQHCKDRIRELDQLNSAGRLFSREVAKGVSCPRHNISNARFIGCRHDFKPLKPGERDYKRTFTFRDDQSCVEFCFAFGCQYAAIHAQTFTCLCSQYSENGQQLSQNCDASSTPWYLHETGTKTIQHVVPEWNFSVKNQKPVRIVFFLMMNGRAIRQFGRLMRVLYRPQHYYYIHIDSRVVYLQDQVRKFVKGLSNVHLAEGPQRFRTQWGGSNLWRMYLESLRILVREKPEWEWDYVTNLSETDFPIRPIEHLAAFLGANNGLTFMWAADSHDFAIGGAVFYSFFECEQHIWRLHERQPAPGVRVFGGSDWYSFTREFVEFIVDGNERQDPFFVDMYPYYNYTFSPLESYFHAMAHNTHFCTKMVNTNLRLVNWYPHRGLKIAEKVATIDWHTSQSPVDLRIWDLAKIQERSYRHTDQLFITRKVEELVAQKIVDLIELKQLYSLPANAESTVPVLNHFWLNEFLSESDDLTSDSYSNRVDMYKAFTRMALNALNEQKIVQSNQFQLLSVHVLNIDSQFYAFLVEFAIPSAEEPGKMFTFEAKLEPIREKEESRLKSIRTSPVSAPIFADWGHGVTDIRVGANYDPKEWFFRHIGPVFKVNQPKVALAITWDRRLREGQQPKLKKHPQGGFQADFSVLITPPAESAVKPLTCMTSAQIDKDQVTLHCASNAFQLTEPGVWSIKVEAVDSGKRFTVCEQLEFAVLGADQENENAKVLSALWSVYDLCTSSPISDHQPLEQCSAKQWSSHFPDPKSYLKPLN